MTLQTENYLLATNRWPKEGQHIMAQYDEASIIVYQAYNHAIADYAVAHQAFGGPSYSYSRMSWIKPNFLWMMHRCGWASKANQERVLAIRISKTAFEKILYEAVFSSFNSTHYSTQEQWRKEMEQKNVRLQWDPDHDPHGNKLTRRAIQLGMKEGVLESFGKREIVSIEDITPFVKAQKGQLDKSNLETLFVPVEEVYKPINEGLAKRIGVA